MTERIRVSSVVPAEPQRVYDAWLSGREHGAMTGGQASVEAGVGGAHSAWDGYITGKNLVLQPGHRIVQSWRSTEFPREAPDSQIEVELEAVRGGTRITLLHSDIPEGQGKMYESGWETHYFKPMRRYFEAAARPTQVMAADGSTEETSAPSSGRKTTVRAAGTAARTSAKKSAAGKRSAKKSTAGKRSAKKSPARKGPAKKSAPKKRPTKKRPAKKSAPKKRPAKKSAPKKSAAKKRAARKRSRK